MDRHLFSIIMGIIRIFFVLCCVTCASSSEPGNPGLISRITENGINYVSRIAIHKLAAKIHTMNIPDLEGNKDKAEYKLSEMRINHFVAPASSTTVSPSSGFTWRTSGTSLKMNGRFGYKVKKIIKISDSGSFDFEASNMDLSITFSIGKDDIGRPNIQYKGCTCNIDNIRIKFHGGASFIYNLFRGLLENKVRKILQEKICVLSRAFIEDDAAKSLSKLRVMADLGKMFLLDYRFVAAPVYHEKYVDLYHRGEIYPSKLMAEAGFKKPTDTHVHQDGEVFWSEKPVEVPFQVPPLPVHHQTNKMVSLWLSDYVFNAISFTAHTNGILVKNLTQENLPDELKEYLSTACDLECIGFFIPKLAEKYPDGLVEINMMTTAPPTLETSDNDMVVRFDGQIDVFVLVPNSNARDLVLRLTATLLASFDIWISEGSIYAKVHDIPISLDVIDSAVGEVNDAILNFAVQGAVISHVESKLNELGAKGFPLPVIEGVHFVNSEIKREKDCFFISSDISYDGIN